MLLAAHRHYNYIMIKNFIAAFVGFGMLGMEAKAQVFLQTEALPVTVAPGGSFSIIVQLVNDTNPDIIQYDFALQSVTSNTETPVSGIFTLTAAPTILSTALTSPNSSPTVPDTLNPLVGTASQPTDLGASTPTNSPSAGLGEGTFNLESLAITVASNAPLGAYQFELYEPPGLGPVDIYDNSGSFANLNTATGPYFTSTIDIVAQTVPEPSAWVLMLVGGGLLLLFRRPVIREAIRQK
jgi:hypothetical protein